MAPIATPNFAGAAGQFVDERFRWTIPGVRDLDTPSQSSQSETPDTLEKVETREDIQEARQVQIAQSISQLARTYTQRSQVHGGNPFHAETGGPLDPNGPQFDPRAWARAFFELQDDPESDTAPPKTLGFAFKDLNVFGFGSDTSTQDTVGNKWLKTLSGLTKLIGKKDTRIDILQDLEGVVYPGETLAVLGPPGSGCSTFLKTVAGETYGFNVDKDAYVNYHGISSARMHKFFKGEAVYTAEVDDHSPELSVGDTLYFAARARAPRVIPGGVSRDEYATHLRDVVMAMFGISHTINTRVGNDYIRGVSGGERKRVTISEATLSMAPVQCWDNSTRGLDSANALEFCRTLRTQADVMAFTSAVAIYQASQSAYDTFTKVLVLYEGRQIFFGFTHAAKSYFEQLGFECPDRQTTADFLTSMTNSSERVVRQGMENRVPRTAEDFARAWMESEHCQKLRQEIQEYSEKFPLDQSEHAQQFAYAKRAQQARLARERSPFLLSYPQQIKLCLWRAVRKLKGDPSIPLIQLVFNLAQALIVASVFYNLPEDTGSFQRRGVLIFFIILINAFSSILEVLTLYAQRPIVEKHVRYAMYHPSAESIAAMITDLPYKITNAIIVNTTLYFMCNLRREPGPFFFFLLVAFTTTLCMSMLFRCTGAATKTLAQALAPSSVLLFAIVLYIGFAIPRDYILGWAVWIWRVNPISYPFESLILNEFANRDFPCSQFVPAGPAYAAVGALERACAIAGSQPGSNLVSGSAWMAEVYGYQNSHRWRNFGILIVFTFILMIMYLSFVELVASEKSKGEVLVFRKKEDAVAAMGKMATDPENQTASQNKITQSRDVDTTKIQKTTATFHWQDVCYDVKIKGGNKRILDHVDGWVRPGTLTALMGVSGAGKTTLLDVLASRVTTGVVTGEMLVDGKLRDDSFQRKTGYVTQQDLHLSTTTVREALEFSALLRQPNHYSRREKLEYVDEVITLLGMEQYANAVVGNLGEGLNVEQRKRLTIGVELAARPQLLLFLDEPTSGLDSQTSWSICDLMQKLTNSGQAILCTIHQPSAMLFQRFDRLLFLAKGGRTVYFGDIGHGSRTLIDYFVRNGSAPCPADANPAEWMLEVIGAAPGAQTDIDWPAVWRSSPEYREVEDSLTELKTNAKNESMPVDSSETKREFAAPFSTQLYAVTRRVWQQYWRTPSYIYSKALLSIASTLLIGLSFINSGRTIQGLQNQMFGIFVFLTIPGTLVEQIIPMFVSQRKLYEARERPAKVYSWKAFMAANVAIEMPYNTVMAALCFIVWWFPIGLYRNAEFTGQEHARGGLAFLFIFLLFLWTSTFAHMLIAGLPGEEAAANIANFCIIMMLIFCGIIAGPSALPGFWIFMYRVSPYTYLVEGVLGTALANAPVACAANEIISFAVPAGQTCATYLASYIQQAGGWVVTPNATGSCDFCPVADTNAFLRSVNVDFGNRWRNFGILWAFVIFNIAAAFALYWLVRVPKKGKKEKKE